ncbi:MAG: alpha/beta hydrolase [Chloroflexota bacterium]|jgi:proline iminopeptidase
MDLSPTINDRIPIRDVSLFVKTAGQGYPLLLLHGGPGMDHTSLLPLLPCGERFTLIYLDQRCNGRSNGIPVHTMTWDNLTADAEALRQKLGFDKWAVLGHSFGGMVALEYALRYPDSLSHLLLMDTCGDTRWVREKAPELLAQRGFGQAAVAGARRFFNGELKPDQVFGTATKFARAYYYRSSRWTLIRQIPAGFKAKMQPEAQIFGFGHLLNGWSVMDRLGQIETPTLVLAGRDDFQFPPEHQAILADRLPNAQLALVERAGHNAPMERPDEVMAIMRRFLAREAES